MAQHRHGIMRALLRAFTATLLAAAAPGLAQDHTEALAQLQVTFPDAKDHRAAPLEFARGKFFVKALINGREAWALLDNGVSSTLVDKTFAKSIGLQTAATTNVLRTATGGLEIGPLPSLDVEVPGQFKLHRVPGVAADLTAVSKTADRPIALIIGEDMFDNFTFLIFPAQQLLDIGPSGSFEATGVPVLELKPDRPQIELVVNGKPVHVTLDLGYNGAVALNLEAWDRLGLKADGSPSETLTTAEGAVVTVPATIVENATAGPLQLRRLHFVAAPVPPGNGDGLIGLGVFSQFNSAIDLKTHRIWIIPQDVAMPTHPGPDTVH